MASQPGLDQHLALGLEAVAYRLRHAGGDQVYGRREDTPP